jgi:hypothetical protein
MKRVGLLLVVTAAFALAVAAAAQATAVPTCTPSNCGTWQPGPVTVTWSSTVSDVSSCDTTLTDDSPDTNGTIVSCNDGDGPIDAHVYVDNTPPSLVAALDRTPDTVAGWYNHPVALNLLGSTDNLSGVATGTCETTPYNGPDALSATLSGTCSDVAGNTASPATTDSFKYDASPPSIDSATLDRPPDRNGWYNHPVGLVLQGSDPTSDPTICTAPTYSGPNGAAAHVDGTCTNQAGLSTTGGAPLAYDDSGPEVLISAERPPDHNGWYNHPVAFTVGGEDGASGIASCAGNTTYSGPQSGNATVSGSCTDGAGNTSGDTKGFAYDSTGPGPASIQVTPGNRRIDLSWSLPPDAVSVIVGRGRAAARRRRSSTRGAAARSSTRSLSTAPSTATRSRTWTRPATRPRPPRERSPRRPACARSWAAW